MSHRFRYLEQILDDDGRDDDMDDDMDDGRDYGVVRRSSFLRCERNRKETKMQRLTCTVTEAADLLGISRTCAYELVRAGTLPALRLGRRIVITHVALEELMGCSLPSLGEPELNKPPRKPAGQGVTFHL